MSFKPLRCFRQASFGIDHVCALSERTSTSIKVSICQYSLLTFPRFHIRIACCSEKQTENERSPPLFDEKTEEFSYVKVFCSTTARRYSACFNTTDDFRGTVKVDVTLPVPIIIHTTAMQPMTLNPIDHILQVGIIPITLNHDH